ncbi:hypothetical protein GV828_01200 [Flavobacterium sp. NST-5]|uniref:TonB-dependent receptor plug domain-containing protein n=1 Tax=Flavobacterium ichthyis TaxID=2698827 RepID=A0ABW9Z9Q2_9FLAO|nr:hypothetical protein [Flavobacterium ichthyis]NBL63810.1 hypothetical protein [Flavobacterium ichthyis]
MNNFHEDESSVYEIQVLNKKEKGLICSTEPNKAQSTIMFFPEGGKIIADIPNVVGVKIVDCNGNPIPVSEMEIRTNEDKLLQKVAINKYGLGKFKFTANQTLKAVIILDGMKVEKFLPPATSTGIALEVSNFSLKDKTVATVRINEKSLPHYQSKKLFLLVHQDESLNLFDINFSNEKLEQTIIFSNENLRAGVSNIRVIDDEKNQHAERSIFKYPDTLLSANLSILKKSRDSIQFKGKLNLPTNSISVSVLPERSLETHAEQNLLSSFLLYPYIKNISKDTHYYFEDISKLKHYAIDLLLLTNNSTKYKWENIISNPPKETNPFDFGITLKGTINQTLKDKKKYRVRMFSLAAGINESAEINEKNEFYFNNLILADSTWVNFTLVDEKNKSTDLKLYPQLLYGRRASKFPFHLNKSECLPITKEYELPKFSERSITLDDVIIEVDQKNILKYNRVLGNANLRGYKVDERDNTEVLDYIRNNGFEVPVNTTSLVVEIYGRSRTTINGARNVPILFIDGLQQINFDNLLNMRMAEIDEIYLNPNAIVASVNNNQGIIKIYKRKGTFNNNQQNDAKVFEIKNAFSKIQSFKNSTYNSFDNPGFQNFGLINWILAILTHDKGEFSFNIPNYNQEKVKLKIEGFSADGKLISEVKIIDLKS